MVLGGAVVGFVVNLFTGKRMITNQENDKIRYTVGGGG